MSFLLPWACLTWLIFRFQHKANLRYLSLLRLLCKLIYHLWESSIFFPAYSLFCLRRSSDWCQLASLNFKSIIFYLKNCLNRYFRLFCDYFLFTSHLSLYFHYFWRTWFIVSLEYSFSKYPCLDASVDTTPNVLHCYLEKSMTWQHNKAKPCAGWNLFLGSS